MNKQPWEVMRDQMNKINQLQENSKTMDNDKAREYINDATEIDYESSCCGANLYNFNDGVGLCAECKEWSDGVLPEDNE